MSDPKIRAQVATLIDLCVAAVRDLDSLDEEVYLQSLRAENRPERSILTRHSLESLAISILSGVRTLDAHLQSIEPAAGDEESSTELEGEGESGFDLDFDFGAPVSAPQDMRLDDDDIAGALDGLAPTPKRSAQESWRLLSVELGTLSYAFSSQLQAFDERFQDALENLRFGPGLQELDAVGNALIDGVFALMASICEAFLEDFDRDHLLPGHRNALGKALLVRRGLAELRLVVNQSNHRLQTASSDAQSKEVALRELEATLAAFLASEVFSAMRSPDRLELRDFHAKLASKERSDLAMVGEGLDKYLDSLVSVSQRDVLLAHDQDVMEEVSSLLEAVPALIDISPHGAMDMVRQAFAKAEALYGARDALDLLLREWREQAAQLLDQARYLSMGQALAALVRTR